MSHRDLPKINRQRKAKMICKWHGNRIETTRVSRNAHLAERKAVETIFCNGSATERKCGRGSQGSKSIKKYGEASAARVSSGRSLLLRQAGEESK